MIWSKCNNLLSKWLRQFRAVPFKKEVREEGAVRAGLLQVGLQSFLQRVFAPNEAPLSHPKRHQETLRMTPQMSQNGPK